MNATTLRGDGIVNGADVLSWENGYSTSDIAVNTVVRQSANSGGDIGESQTRFAQATGATIAATLGRTLLNVQANTLTRAGGTLKLVNQWLVIMTTTGATVGDPIFLNDSGALSLTAGTIPKVVGWVDVVGAAGVGRAFFAPHAVRDQWFTEAKILANSGANAPNSTDETAYDLTIAVPARHFFKGRRMTITGSIRFTATHSTDTATIKVKVGGLTLFTSAAVDVANNDTFQFRAELVMRSAFSATAEVVGSYNYSFSTSGEVVTQGLVADASAIDNTGALTVQATCTWSVADVGNSSFLEMLNVRIELP